MARLIKGRMTPGAGRKKNPFLCRSPLFAGTEVGLTTPPGYKAGSVSDEETVWFTPQEVATPAVKDSEANTYKGTDLLSPV